MNSLPKLRRAAGIDIGGTKMAVSIVDGQGHVLSKELLATEAELGFSRAVDRLCHTLARLASDAGITRLDGIGIGCAGPVDPKRGLINNPYTLAGWNGCDVVTPLRQRFGAPVYLENDADAAGFGECTFGAGQGADPVVMLTFGTGIGGAAVIGGEVLRGVHGEHPELGHIPVAPDGPACYCGTRGCLEALASGTAISTAGQAIGLPDARAVFAANAAGQAKAAAIIAAALQASATAAWTIFHTLLPERLVLGGGMMDDHFDLFSKAMAASLKPATQFPVAAVQIVRATLGNDAGLVGSAALALRRVASPRAQQVP